MTRTTNSPVRTAVVGYGLAGAVFHAPLIAATDGLALTAVVTGNEAGAASRQDIDLVVVASPNSTHVPIGLAVLDAGLPVVIDKPVAATVAAACRLRYAAAKKGLLVSVYHN